MAAQETVTVGSHVVHLEAGANDELVVLASSPNRESVRVIIDPIQKKVTTHWFEPGPA